MFASTIAGSQVLPIHARQGGVLALMLLALTILPVVLAGCRMLRLNSSLTSGPGFQQERGTRALSTLHEQTGSRFPPNLDSWRISLSASLKFAHLIICTP